VTNVLRCALMMVCLLAAAVSLLCVPTGSILAEEKPVSQPAQLAQLKSLAEQVQHLEQVPVQEQPWGWLRWLVNDQLVPGATMTLGVVQIHAGQKNPPHQHPNCDEVIYVLSGSCTHRVGDQSVVLRAGDALRIPKGVPHGATVLGNEPMKCVVVYDTGNRQFVPVEE